MRTSPIYRNAVLYEAAMRVLYGRAYHDRDRALADVIPDGSSVLDLCCGPGTLFRRYLKRKGVRYTGLDINAGFVARLSASGAVGLVWNLEESRPLPRAEYVVMQASLYHFLALGRFECTSFAERRRLEPLEIRVFRRSHARRASRHFRGRLRRPLLGWAACSAAGTPEHLSPSQGPASLRVARLSQTYLPNDFLATSTSESG